MKNICLVMFFLLGCGVAYGYEVCGPAITAIDVGYTSVARVGDDGIYIGYWAVGAGCVGSATTEEDVVDLCDSVVAGGTAFCGPHSWPIDADLNEASATNGKACWCRRTNVDVVDVLVDSVGQAVLIGELTDVAKCRSSCARMCAESVALNENGMRNPIMVLPAF